MFPQPTKKSVNFVNVNEENKNEKRSVFKKNYHFLKKRFLFFKTILFLFLNEKLSFLKTTILKKTIAFKN